MEHTAPIKKSADTLAKDVERIGMDARELADTAVEESRKAWKNLRKQGTDVLENAVEEGQEAVESASRLFRKYPVRALGIAFAAGALLAAFLIPKNND